MCNQFLENLERRTLLAGVTLLTHGRDGHLWGFVNTAAADITARLGGPSQVPQYILKLTPDSNDGHLVTSISHVDGTTSPQNNNSGEIVLLVDFTSVDSNTSYSLAYIGSVVADYMMNTPVDGMRLSELPLHEISISRGTGLLDEIAKALGKSGVWVDQETYTDPNPVGVMGDAPPTIYDNVAFVDNYWRSDDNPDNFSTNGRFVEGAYNLRTQWLDSHWNGWAMKHLLPAGYYVGTIDTNTTNGGEGPIYPDWYGNTPDKPARDQTGYIYDHNVGAPRPLSGVWAPSGGSGARTTAGQDGQQWANLTDLRSTNGDNFRAGQSLNLAYLQQDRDDRSTVTIYLDNDRNPYNGSSNNLGQTSFDASSSITSRRTTVSTRGAAPGTYWLGSKIVDEQGHTRFAYGKQITITQGSFVDARIDSNRILRVNGTDNSDAIRITLSASNADRLVVMMGDTSTAFDVSQVQRIFVYGKGGNDNISINEKYGEIGIPARLLGDAGDDVLIGGSSNDTLEGGDGNDRLYGGAGRDRLDGGLGSDRLWGQGGRDSFVASKTKELMDFKKKDDSLV